MSPNNRIFADGPQSGDEIPIIIDRQCAADRWRYRCPRGHTSWEPMPHAVFCKSCSKQSARANGIGAVYHHLIDEKTGDAVPYSYVELIE